MIPSRKNAEQMASVGIMSRRVEQASANPARIQSANKISTAAGTSRQSTPLANGCGFISLLKKLITINAIVTITIRLSTASDVNGRRRKKLVKPPSKYAAITAEAKVKVAN